VHAVASCWYTAWLDAGSPDLSRMDGVSSAVEEEDLKKSFENGKILGRPEEH
jgi:hypothetical protein